LPAVGLFSGELRPKKKKNAIARFHGPLWSSCVPRVNSTHAYCNNSCVARRGMNFRYGARWLGLAAQKGQHQAQALLGQILFAGDPLPRQPRAPEWLTLARTAPHRTETWIKESYNRHRQGVRR